LVEGVAVVLEILVAGAFESGVSVTVVVEVVVEVVEPAARLDLLWRWRTRAGRSKVHVRSW